MLYFKAVDDFKSSNPYISMKWSEFSIPELVGNTQLTNFNCKTFASFTKEGLIGLSRAYDPVNGFLKTLDVEDQRAIAIAFVVMHALIQKSEKDKSSLISLENEIRERIVKLVEMLNLYDKVRDYIKLNIPVSDMKDAGTRPQDSVDMTFGHEEAVEVTIIAVMMKLFSCIIGAFMYKFSDSLADNTKEGHVYILFTPLFAAKFEKVVLKLEQYIKQLLSKQIKTDPTATYNGQTLETLSSLMLYTVVTKRFVGVDLHRYDGNVIRYIASCCTAGVDSAQKNAASKNGVKIIADPSSSADESEGNASRMEAGSRQSSNTADTPVRIKVAVRNICKRLIAQYDLDQELVDAAIAFYTTSHPTITPIALYILSSYYGPEIGGGKGIYLLRFPEMIKMITVLQMILFKYGSYELGHSLSVVAPEGERNPMSDDHIFSRAWKSIPEYADCKRIFPVGFGEKEWNTYLVTISEFLIRKKLTYNTAPAFLDMVPEYKNGTVLDNYLEIMKQVMICIRVIFVNNIIDKDGVM